ncbi:MAG: hypothetical protein ACPGN3_12315 [Opitutales bacterium]
MTTSDTNTPSNGPNSGNTSKDPRDFYVPENFVPDVNPEPRVTYEDHTAGHELLTHVVGELMNAAGMNPKLVKMMRESASGLTDHERKRMEICRSIIETKSKAVQDRDAKLEKIRLQGMADVLIDKFWGSAMATRAFFLSGMTAIITATFTVTFFYVKSQSLSASVFSAVGIAFIAALGSFGVKFATHGPLSFIRQPLEALLVVFGFSSFALFVRELTNKFFYIVEQSSSIAPPAPNFGAGIAMEVAPPSIIDLSNLYLGAMGSEVFFSYCFLIFFKEGAYPYLNAALRVYDIEKHAVSLIQWWDRRALNKARAELSALIHKMEIGKAPGKALAAFVSRFSSK